MVVLFSDFPRETRKKLNDAYWDVASFAKMVLGHEIRFLRNGDLDKATEGADVLIVFSNFAHNMQMVQRMRKLKRPVLEVPYPPMSVALEFLQHELWKIEHEKA